MSPIDDVWRYHDGTKHHFGRYARSLGYLDWASQPKAFRGYAGAAQVLLPPNPAGAAAFAFLGDLLRYSLGLSAWKQAGPSRWALRVNPSSGNLHPTEAYVLCGGVGEHAPSVWHYAPDAHALEQRCAIDHGAWRALTGGRDIVCIGLTSIHWREAWKYGERAFRYCQHDLGHAIAAIAISARMLGWRAMVAPGWSHAHVAKLCGVDRADDFTDVEPEEAGCVLVLVPEGVVAPPAFGDGVAVGELLDGGVWTGRASQLSEDHVQWSFIDEIAEATRSVGAPSSTLLSVSSPPGLVAGGSNDDLRRVILQRRSAVALDGHSFMEAETFFNILAGTLPRTSAPWDALWWPPSIHLLLFVHRVRGLDPGLYLLARSEDGGARLHAALGRAFEVAAVHPHLPLTRLGRGDCRGLARQLSCQQDIAADGAFSLGMIAEFDGRLVQFGDAFYRNLFWESGVVGQMLYLEAEAAGVRGTGIGCFFDDPVHDVLGLSARAYQSLYHFTIGTAVDDRRLATERGYPWEG